MGTLKKNDFLRQVIGYDYPNYPWEKDNYRVKQEYRDLVQEVLAELKPKVQDEPKTVLLVRSESIS